MTFLKNSLPPSCTKPYEADYYHWITATVQKLKKQEWEAIDWENLIEEVEDLGRRQKRKLESLLTRLLEHLLKLKYWHSESDRNANPWKTEILTFRKQIAKELQDSPSLRPYLNSMVPELYGDAQELVATRSNLPLATFPATIEASLEEILDPQWFL